MYLCNILNDFNGVSFVLSEFYCVSYTQVTTATSGRSVSVALPRSFHYPSCKSLLFLLLINTIILLLL